MNAILLLALLVFTSISALAEINEAKVVKVVSVRNATNRSADVARKPSTYFTVHKGTSILPPSGKINFDKEGIRLRPKIPDPFIEVNGLRFRLEEPKKHPEEHRLLKVTISR